MSAQVRPLWLAPPPDWEARLAKRLDQAAEDRAEVFFRADDAAVRSENFLRMLETFERRGTPLDLAVVPAWLTAPRAETLLQDATSDLFSLHQHGYRHVNHEARGKKCEFGPGRPAAAKARDLGLGARRLRQLLGERSRPIFTPPWNRADAETLAALAEHGFQGLSRSAGAAPDPPAGIACLDVNVDLHTRKDPDPGRSLIGLLDELSSALRTGRAGIMLHHQVMNEAAFIFLDRLLQGLSQLPGVSTRPMEHLAATFQD